MNQDYIKADSWSIVEEGYSAEQVISSESLFSIGNGAMGQRANFEEYYSGPTFQGSYIGGVYYPDKTKVGWWKNGYPEYFAKVLNAPSWIGIHFHIDGEALDLNSCTEVKEYRRELNMKEGWHKRSFYATTANGFQVQVEATRFLSIQNDEIGAIKYDLTLLSADADVQVTSFLDSGIKNHDSNWDDDFWSTTAITSENNTAFIEAHTNKTEFRTATFMGNEIRYGGTTVQMPVAVEETDTKVSHIYKAKLQKEQTLTVFKYGGYVVERNHLEKGVLVAAKEAVQKAFELGYDRMFADQIAAWATIWASSDIVIDGDVKAQQGIRFNVFQLNQTYLGKDATLNIGPKGFTGEKYGGSTYWDTEAYCIPFYMATKNEEVARNLLQYRYNQLDRAIENAEKLGFKNGAALYPMVTMNGEECHNEWEITFEEIHRNGAIAFAIFNYYRYTGDYSYIPEAGLEVLIAISRFWHQRATFSTHKDAYVILGVTGPNEYENNVNNNFYTNYIAKWCIDYTVEQIQKVKDGYPDDYHRIMGVTKLKNNEIEAWKKVADGMYFPYDEERGIYLQQDGFLDKEQTTVSQLTKEQRPINQKWSWDRILRSPFIKQADVLQGFYFFEENFSEEELERHFDFYEPFTVHESSLSPCVHSIQAAKLNRMEQAYAFYLRTSRLDLDDYNKEVEEGLHITSMAGTWMSIVEGFAGMRIQSDKLSFTPRIPEQWDAYSFKINFRNRIVKITIDESSLKAELTGDTDMSIRVNGARVVLSPGKETIVKL
jgi:maltose phosphorylase